MKAKLTFHKLIQDTQDVVSGDPNQNHMVSRAYFTLDLGGKQYGDMSVVLRQPFGTDYATEPIEVEKASGSYTGNWNCRSFAKFKKLERVFFCRDGSCSGTPPSFRLLESFYPGFKLLQ